MNVLLIGAGGREHALAVALAKSPLLEKLFVAPGNPGTAKLAHNVALDPADFAAVIAFCHIQAIGFVVIGPEQPLVDGLVDALNAAGIKSFGPSKAAARLEGSKGFTKDICARYHIPTGAYRRFTEREPALAYLREKGAPIVVKADGLAAGKGVAVAMSLAEAEAAVESLFDGAFGAAGAEVVIEAFLDGEEASFFALCDGDKALAFASAQDHKRLGDGDVGPNTGGMGAYSPAPVMTPEISNSGDEGNHRADRRGDEGRRLSLQRRAVRRPDDRQGWAAVDRIQHALRRPGMPGHAGASRRRSSGAAARLRRRPPARRRASFAQNRFDRRYCGARLSGGAAKGRLHRRD